MFGTDELPPVRPLPRERRNAMRDMLLEEIQGRRPWWRRSGRGAAVGAGALALVLAGGAASAYVAFKTPSDTGSVYCYTVAGLDGGDSSRTRLARAEAGQGNAAGEGNVAGASPINHPVSACADLWRQGVLSERPDGVNPDAVTAGGRHRVPRLVACTLDESVAAVFPGGPGTCERLGLPRAQSR